MQRLLALAAGQQAERQPGCRRAGLCGSCVHLCMTGRRQARVAEGGSDSGQAGAYTLPRHRDACRASAAQRCTPGSTWPSISRAARSRSSRLQDGGSRKQGKPLNRRLPKRNSSQNPHCVGKNPGSHSCPDRHDFGCAGSGHPPLSIPAQRDGTRPCRIPRPTPTLRSRPRWCRLAPRHQGRRLRWSRTAP